MEQVSQVIGSINGWVWGPPMLILILGTGLYLSIGLKAMPLHRLGYGFRMLWRGRKEQGSGDITPFNALMTSLSATIGTGNIAYHDLHHFNPSIPSYNLRRAQKNLPDALKVHDEIRWPEALASFRLKLWDEATGKLVPFPAKRQAGHVAAE